MTSRLHFHYLNHIKGTPDMNIGSVLALASKVQEVLPDLENAGMIFAQFVISGVSTMETTGKTGEEKLAAVLNSAEVAFKGLGDTALSTSFEALAPLVTTVVTDVVAIWNATGVFVHQVGLAVGAVEKAVS